MDTIFALASGRGKAGVAVIRISGRGAWPAVQSLAGDLPVPRRASLRRLRDRSGQELDQALVVLFPAGASFTGEDVAELQLHGSPAVVAAVSEALAAEPDLRPAEPGEFTRRALQNGRLDLAQVEGLADLINAETEAQRLQAQRLFDGALGERVMAWRASLLRASSLIVAAVDFAEEDVPQDVRAACAAEISGVRDALVAEQEGAFFAERVRDGFEIAIVGPPNAGKSTLLNYLAGREAALTSEQAGTTRDVIEVRMDLGGLPVTLLDMAGLRETEDAVEAAGVARAMARAEAADIRVFLLPSDSLPGRLFRDGDIRLRGKADLQPLDGQTDETECLPVSGRTGMGIDALLERIEVTLELRAARPSLFNRARHRRCVEEARVALGSALGQIEMADPAHELVAEDLRRAIRSLESLIGKVDIEDVLDEVFARFCIGK
ncbi:MAG: tRNA uridine-5-carboxymethylaminomethyl(34) synthesis GTPase MnmE [Rhodobacteraceae bacterium]|jgi:tRNA modification GTPase|nr:tRNA uridine-5-carboxymethylaminomethyl(34) synthesis GTPase MnmE [Paracoccaceae bacterium]MBL4557432.1 tRNA uridine-5-carboxymethylaminomethyl(34) synthesis GTPase MnmE [Paracoccaceae bacterium]HBG97740.1 tRNA uridine-5-carboxymethylaminomethyl(34) synthesis GTPase MnmE [Paracoccaceae bacterium]